MIYLGIDVGKKVIDCVVLDENGANVHKRFSNSIEGFELLGSWMRQWRRRKVHACMEASGGYGDDLASYLTDLGYLVSVENPAKIRAFGQAELTRTKTDKADAQLIARYCQAMSPVPWVPPSPMERKLRHLVRRRRGLVEMHAKEVNRLKSPALHEAKASINASIAFLEEQISVLDRDIKKTIDKDQGLAQTRDLIESISGVGPTTSSTLLAETRNIRSFPSSKALAAFAGVCPEQRRSGTSVNSTHVTRIGNRAIRRVLYMAALAALRHNPVIQVFAQRLRDRGKKPAEVTVAVMRKLLVLVYGVLKTGQRFDPTWAANHSPSEGVWAASSAALTP